ncbi:hypothetical protein SH139x_005579 [Planctomycetaceae bacterium SH139]
MRKRQLQFGIAVGFGISVFVASNPLAAQNPNRVVDPLTGQTYERRFRTVERPSVETRLEPKVVTISRPEVVTELEPVHNTYFTPVVRYDWQPRWHNTWNPFVAPTLAYHYAPRTQWEARTETYNRPRTTTRWVAEKRVVNEPRRITTMRREQVEDWVAVSPGPGPQTIPGSGLEPQPATQVATLPTAPPARPKMGGMPPTVLNSDPYSTRTMLR